MSGIGFAFISEFDQRGINNLICSGAFGNWGISHRIHYKMEHLTSSQHKKLEEHSESVDLRRGHHTF